MDRSRPRRRPARQYGDPRQKITGPHPDLPDRGGRGAGWRLGGHAAVPRPHPARVLQPLHLADRHRRRGHPAAGLPPAQQPREHQPLPAAQLDAPVNGPGPAAAALTLPGCPGSNPRETAIMPAQLTALRPAQRTACYDGTAPFPGGAEPPPTTVGRVRAGVTGALVIVPFAGLAAAVWLAWGHGLGLGGGL